MKKIESFSRQVVEVFPILMREIMKREDSPLTRGMISFPQMVALDHLSRHSKVKMSELARVLSIKMSSATSLVDRLITQRMLTREGDAEDRRIVWIKLSLRGRKAVQRIIQQKSRAISDIFSILTDLEREQYLRVLLKIHNHLNKPQS